MINRQLKPYLIQAAARHPIIILGGAPKVGKTTLVRNTFDYNYVSLRDLDTRTDAANDPEGFLKVHFDSNKKLIIDDIHLVPVLLRYLPTKSIAPGALILTTSRRLTQEQRPKGAYELILLPPSLEELRESKITIDSVEQAIWQSGIAALHPDTPPLTLYQQMADQIFAQEIPRHLRLHLPETFFAFTRLAAGAIGEVINYSRLGDNCGVSHNSCRVWMKALIDHYLAFQLLPYPEGYGKRVVKTPKLYFTDTGFASYLTGIKNPQDLLSHYQRGALFENLMINQIQTNSSIVNQNQRLYFWRDKLGNEIDLLMDDGERLLPIEFKAGRTISASYFEGLNRWNLIAGSSPENGTIVYGGDADHSHPMARLIGWKSVSDLIAPSALF